MDKVSNENIVGEEPRAEGLAFLYSERVPVRDPFILRVGGTYYLYEGLHKEGVLCYTSPDLEHWYGPVTVFHTPENFHGVKDFYWAPEVHFYRGAFYLFTSVFSSKTGHRCISAYRSKSPLGPFEDIAGGCVSVPEWDCIDGTLFLDDDKKPWMVFVHEWVCVEDGNGGMCAARLSDDLTRMISKPIPLFWALDQKKARTGVTDGPYLYRMDNGTLLMTWSNYGKEDYFIAEAVSESGKIEGPWKQREELLYARGQDGATADGGHGMVFRRADGVYMMAFHAPNAHPFEYLVLREIEEKDGGIVFRKGK